MIFVVDRDVRMDERERGRVAWLVGGMCQDSRQEKQEKRRE